MRYGDDALKAEMQNFTQYIKDRNFKAYQESVFKRAAAIMKSAKTIKEYEEVKQLLIPIRSFGDVEALIEKCNEAISDIESQHETIIKTINEAINKRDYAKAAEWYQKAAEQGDADAQNGLGVLYKKGRGVKRDYAKALEWYRKSVLQGEKNTV